MLRSRRMTSANLAPLFARETRGLRAGDALLLSRFEAQARGHLEEALLLVAGKLREAERAMREVTEEP